MQETVSRSFPRCHVTWETQALRQPLCTMPSSQPICRPQAGTQTCSAAQGSWHAWVANVCLLFVVGVMAPWTWLERNPLELAAHLWRLLTGCAASGGGCGGWKEPAPALMLGSCFKGDSLSAMWSWSRSGCYPR